MSPRPRPSGFRLSPESRGGRAGMTGGVGFDNNRFGEERSELFGDHYGTGSGSAAAVRGREGLVEVGVADIDAQIAEFDESEQCVQVGPVGVD